MGLFLDFVEVSMGRGNASGSQREREAERDRETECVKMTEEVWANTDAKPCVFFGMSEADRQVLAHQKGMGFFIFMLSPLSLSFILQIYWLLLLCRQQS